jgi:phenylacetate-CoA ligase
LAENSEVNKLNCIFKITLALSGFPIRKSEQEFHQANKLSKEQRADLNFRFHSENNLFYQSFLKSKHSGKIECWSDIPVITKKDFQINIDEIITEGLKKSELHVHNTSGSTGTPFYFAKDKFCHAMNWSEIDYHLLKHGINIGASKQARFYGIPLSGIKYYKERLKDFLANRVRFPVFDLSDEKLTLVLNEFKKMKFEYINGYTSSLVIFAKFLIERKIVLKEICPSIKVVFPTSEVVDVIDRKTMERGFGVRVRNEYGAAELDILAFEDEDDDFVLNEETLYIEILDDNNQPVEAGIEGKVIVTSLYNKAMPFIRYELGDRAILSNKIKNGNRVLEKVVGRTNDIIKLPSGKISPGLTFYYISKKLLESGGRIKEFIIIQKTIDTFLFNYVANEELSASEKIEIQKAMDLYLEPGLVCEFSQCEFIERTKAGKLKHFFTELN